MGMSFTLKGEIVSFSQSGIEKPPDHLACSASSLEYF